MNLILSEYLGTLASIRPKRQVNTEKQRMTRRYAAQSLIPLCVAFVCVASLAPRLSAQEGKPLAPSVGLQEFFAKVLSSPSSPPPSQDLHKLTLELAHAPSQEIARGLSSVFAALGLQDENSKAYACAALFAIARREDGADLLRLHVSAIGSDLLSTNLSNIRAGEIEILGAIRPSPPPEAVSILLEFVRRDSPEAQSLGAGVIFQLIQIAPDDPRVIQAIQEFLSRATLDRGTKIAALNAVGNLRVKNHQIEVTVTSFLSDSDQDVRTAAIRVVTRMGRRALELAEPALLRLANDPAQPEQVRKEANRALGISNEP